MKNIINVKIDKHLKDSAQEVAKCAGLNVSTLVNAYYITACTIVSRALQRSSDSKSGTHSKNIYHLIRIGLALDQATQPSMIILQLPLYVLL